MQQTSRVRRYSLARRVWENVQNRFWNAPWAKMVERLLNSPHSVTITNISVEHTLLDHPPLRIAFAADFHAGPTTSEQTLNSAIQALQEAAPDILLLGGDYVVLNARHIDSLCQAITNIHAPLGRFAVLGNHDLWADYSYIERNLQEAGFKVLTNKNERLLPPFQDVWICGLDDAYSGYPNVEAAFQGSEGVRVVLMHAPSTLLDIGEERFELALCGHTHGGQIALPGGTPLIVPRGRLSRRYSRGAFSFKSGSTLFVTRGIGCSTLPFRLFSPPEVVICTLTGKSQKN